MPKNQAERIIDTPFAAQSGRGAVIVSGGGGDGGGGTAYTAGYAISIVNGVISVVPATLADTARGISSVGNKLGMRLRGSGGLAFDNGELILDDGIAGTGLAIDGSKVLSVRLKTQGGLGFEGGEAVILDSLAGAGLEMGAGKVMTLDPDIAGDGLSIHPTSKILSFRRRTDSGLLLDGTGAAVGEGSDIDVTDELVSVISSSDVSGTNAAARVLKSTAQGRIGLSSLFTSGDVAVGHDLAVADTLLYVDADSKAVAVNAIPDGGAALHVQSANVDDVTQRLRQIANQTARLWRVENTAGDELIVLDSVGNLQSGRPGFVSGLLGWQITPEGNAEFNNGWFRGELHASIFVMDEFHATGGTLVVATAGKLRHDTDITTTPVTSGLEVMSGGTRSPLQFKRSGAMVAAEVRGPRNYIDIDDPPSGHAVLFPRDVALRCKSIGSLVNGGPLAIYDMWFRVNYYESRTDTDGATYMRYHVQHMSGTGRILPAGAAIISYGKQGDGRILLTSDLNYAPYQDIFTVGAEPWTGAAGSIVPHVRLGRLDGVGVQGVSGIAQWGMIAGTDLSNANSPHIVASDRQMRLFRVDLEAHNGISTTARLTSGGALKLGTDINNPNTTGLQYDPVLGRFLLGRTSAQYLEYNEATGLISTNMDILIGGQPAQAYVDDAADSALDQAISYANMVGETAEANAYEDATAYGEARRVVAVSGVIVPNAVVKAVQWADVIVRFGNGTQKAVTDSAIGTWLNTPDGTTGRWYFYIDATAAAPLTMQRTTSLTTLGPSHALLAVVDKPNAGVMPSVQVVAGRTYISGPHIVTGTIQTAHLAAGSVVTLHLAAGAVTAEKISVTSLDALSGKLGTIVLSDTLGGVWSGGLMQGKTGPDIGLTGMFLGYYGSQVPILDMVTGHSGAEANWRYLQWTGQTLNLRVGDAVTVRRRAASNDPASVLQLQSGGAGLYTANFLLGTTGAATGLFLDQHLRPFGDNTLDLGHSTRRWRDLYLSGALNVATLSAATVAPSSALALGSGVSIQGMGGATTYASWQVNGSNWTGTIYYFRFANVTIMTGRVERASSNNRIVCTNVPSAAQPQRRVYFSGSWTALLHCVWGYIDGNTIEIDGPILADSGFLTFDTIYLN